MPEPIDAKRVQASCAVAEVRSPILTKSQQQRISLCAIGIGAPMSVLPSVLLDASGPLAPLGIATVIIGVMTYWLGCITLAKSKGYPSDYGEIAAMLLLPGIIGLLLMRDRRKGEI